jgi:hypothetical protein
MTRMRHSCRNAGAAALMWLLLGALMPFAAQAKVYFTAFLAGGGTGIDRAGFEGEGLETLQSQPTGFEDDLALEVAGGKMYWTDSDASVIWRSNLNGTDAQIVLDDFGAQPLGIALDVAGGKMYWTDSEGVKRASLDGTQEELLSKEPARGFIALDLATRRMYWADYKSGDIKTAGMAPGAPVTNLITKQTSAFGIAVDPAADKIYWLDLNLEKRKNETDEIRRANLDGSGVQTLVERPGAGFEGGLAIEPAAGKLYWTEAETHDIAVSKLDGSQAETLFSTGEDVPEGLALETADPHPTNTLAPSIEGSAQVGSQLSCNPGGWTGTGPLSFDYQWAIVGGSVLDGAADGTYVPSSEQADEQLQCVVTAADSVATSSAASSAVSVAALPGAPTLYEATIEAPLIAGIAFARSTVSGTTAHVAVFSSLPGTATLTAMPAHKVSSHGRTSHGVASRRGTSHGVASRRARAAHTVTSREARAARRVTSGPRSESVRKPRAITVRHGIAAGRDTITLHKLTPGTAYRLVLTVTSSGGQVAKDAAALIVTGR